MLRMVVSLLNLLSAKAFLCTNLSLIESLEKGTKSLVYVFGSRFRNDCSISLPNYCGMVFDVENDHYGIRIKIVKYLCHNFLL